MKYEITEELLSQLEAGHGDCQYPDNDCCEIPALIREIRRLRKVIQDYVTAERDGS